MIRKAALIFSFLCLICYVVSAQEAEVLNGFSPASSALQLQQEKKLTELLSPAEMEKHLQWLTSRPHRAGTEGARVTAEYIRDRLQEYGLPAEIVRYEGYLPSPVSVSVVLLEPVRENIPVTEERIESDPFTSHPEEHPGWNGYSPSGEAEGLVVYAHHGSASDLSLLAASGIDVRGKILLMRYFGTGEGTKVRNAERAGAAGVILYSDPMEDGYRYGDVYPKGNWRPPGSIMRRSINPLPYDGDPLSPGWASVAGAKRLMPEETALPKIPVLPISYASAEKILRLLDGAVVPYDWQGALPLPYKFGPGPAKVHIRTEMDNRDHPMWNVISRIDGEQEKDQWIIVGNHHDAWIYGAGDPSSGTASLLDLARGLGELIRQGQRPRRTLILAFWDAEEMALAGSTEWVEDHAAELLQKAVACINMDSSVFNPDRPLSVNAHPVLHELFRSAARHIRDPRTGKSTFDAWVDLQNRYRTTPSVDGWGDFFDTNRELNEPWIFASPSDDAAPFFHHLALPASDMYYGADYGMYHSLYENFHWMKTVVDPTFEYHKVMALLQGFVALRLANADLLPFDYAGEARHWKLAYQDLASTAKERTQNVPLLKQSLDLLDRWEKAASGLIRESNEKLKKDGRHDFTELNKQIFLMARDFYRPDGRPEMPGEKNMLVGSSPEQAVSGSTLPGIRFSLDRKDQRAAELEARLYLNALLQRLNHLENVRKQLKKM